MACYDHWLMDAEDFKLSLFALRSFMAALMASSDND
jgi:hypothetical protein